MLHKITNKVKKRERKR